MVLAYHLIFTAYGFWLPNDPRGSWSDFIRSWELFLRGRATRTTQRRSLARDEHDQHRRREQKHALKHPPVAFSGRQALAVAHGFARAVRESGYVVLACAIMPDHVHLVILRHERLAERIMGHLKSRATQALVAEGLHPFVGFTNQSGRFPSVWAHRGWKVFLCDDTDIRRAVRYVQDNPSRSGLPKQRWSFVSAVESADRRAPPRKRGR